MKAPMDHLQKAGKVMIEVIENIAILRETNYRPAQMLYNMNQKTSISSEAEWHQIPVDK